MAPKKNNPRKEHFLSNLPQQDFVSDIADIKGKLSFSFKFFDGNQEAGQDFKDWNDKQKQELLEKIRDYSRESKQYWLTQRVGGGGLCVLEIYGVFPHNTDFVYPRHVPDEVKWARFRMESAMRLVGFFVPEDISKKLTLSSDVFYVVFLDKDHRFYKMEKR
ncbi:MAG: hypothetical protein IJT92_07030 [Spirochaetia bacterium]|nr:hypothetical protein [Spirochaetia bacterium]